jgi:hypothetical protein
VASVVRIRLPSRVLRRRLRKLPQADEKIAEKAVNDALLKLGNLVHDSVLVDNNEARQPAPGAAPAVTQS